MGHKTPPPASETWWDLGDSHVVKWLPRQLLKRVEPCHSGEEMRSIPVGEHGGHASLFPIAVFSATA